MRLNGSVAYQGTGQHPQTELSTCRRLRNNFHRLPRLKMNAISLFTGVGGLELGLRKFFNPITLVECEARGFDVGWLKGTCRIATFVLMLKHMIHMFRKGWTLWRKHFLLASHARASAMPGCRMDWQTAGLVCCTRFGPSRNHVWHPFEGPGKSMGYLRMCKIYPPFLKGRCFALDFRTKTATRFSQFLSIFLQYINYTPEINRK